MTAQRAGFVLVSVLWVTAILTVLALGFGRRAMLDRRAATISVDYAIVRAEARGQVQQGAAEIVNTMALLDLLDRRNQGVQIPQFQYKEAPDPKSLAGEEGDENEDLAYYTVTDEERKIAINVAPEELLEAIPQLTFSMVNEIIRRRGGESADEPPTPFQSIEEVRQIDGISDDDWFGDENDPGIKDLITLWGDGKINYNTASEDVLRLIPELDEDIVNGIVEFRRGPDGELGTEDDLQFQNINQLIKRLDLSPEEITPLQEFAKQDSSFFRITGVATLRGGKIRSETTAVVGIGRDGFEILRWSEDSPRG